MRPLRLSEAAPDAEPLGAAALAKRLPQRNWRPIIWRDGTNTLLKSRFLRVRVTAAGDGTGDSEPVEWLLVEWPKGEKEPTKFWLSTLSETMPLDRMVDITMMRWRIERDYHDLKQEVGLGHFEGRGWRGFHHFPLRISIRKFHRGICRSRRLSTQRIPRSGLNGTCPIQSRRWGAASTQG